MGRCGGLKEGGHHRKALDLAAKKRAEKLARKEAQVDAGVRAITLNKILALDPDVDVYLDAPGGRPVCRSYFRSDRCGNRRCKFSHEYTIADALTKCTPAAISSKGKRGEENDTTGGGGSMPAVELVRGICGAPKKRRNGPAVRPPVPGAAGFFEEVSEPIVCAIVAFCPSDADVGRMAQSCRFVRRCLMDCRDVERRRGLVVDEQLRVRNSLLMKRSTAARLRFAVSHPRVDANPDRCFEERKGDTKQMSGRRKVGKVKQIRSTLAYDFENADVFKAFEDSLRKQLSKV